MAEAIGIRLDEDFLKKIEKLSKEEILDRSTVLRKLIQVGYDNIMKQKAAQKYTQGKVTISEAARQAELTVWEMEKFLVENGFKSEYSIEDLDGELKLLKK